MFPISEHLNFIFAIFLPQKNLNKLVRKLLNFTKKKNGTFALEAAPVAALAWAGSFLALSGTLGAADSA